MKSAVGLFMQRRTEQSRQRVNMVRYIRLRLATRFAARRTVGMDRLQRLGWRQQHTAALDARPHHVACDVIHRARNWICSGHLL